MNEADFEAALMGLADTHGQMLFRVAHGILRRPDLAEDVCSRLS